MAAALVKQKSVTVDDLEDGSFSGEMEDEPASKSIRSLFKPASHMGAEEASPALSRQKSTSCQKVEAQAMQAFRAKQKDRRLSTFLKDRNRLMSEVGEHDAFKLLMRVRGESPLQALDEDEVHTLAAHIAIARFGARQQIIEQGEPGSWFGILLQGTIELRLPDSPGTMELVPGAVIGEMAIWEPGARRSASLKGVTPGCLGLLLVSELEAFTKEFPLLGTKFIKLMGQVAMGKLLHNLKHATSSYIKPQIAWHNEVHGRDDDGALGVIHSERDGKMAKLLRRYGFGVSEINALSRIAQFHAFSSKEVMVRSSQSWPYLMLVLSGTVWLDRWKAEVGEGGIINSVDMFELTKTWVGSTSVHGIEPGVLAGFYMPALEELMSTNGAVGHRMYFLVGEFTMRLFHTSEGTLPRASTKWQTEEADQAEVAMRTATAARKLSSALRGYVDQNAQRDSKLPARTGGMQLCVACQRCPRLRKWGQRRHRHHHAPNSQAPLQGRTRPRRLLIRYR